MGLSEWSYSGEELAAPPQVFDKAWYSVDFVTPKDLRPIALPTSHNVKSIDPPLSQTVVDVDMAELVKKYDDPSVALT